MDTSYSHPTSKTVTLRCPNCGVVESSDFYKCDICGCDSNEIQLGGTWYTTTELDLDNPFVNYT